MAVGEFGQWGIPAQNHTQKQGLENRALRRLCLQQFQSRNH